MFINSKGLSSEIDANDGLPNLYDDNGNLIGTDWIGDIGGAITKTITSVLGQAPDFIGKFLTNTLTADAYADKTAFIMAQEKLTQAQAQAKLNDTIKIVSTIGVVGAFGIAGIILLKKKGRK